MDCGGYEKKMKGVKVGEGFVLRDYKVYVEEQRFE